MKVLRQEQVEKSKTRRAKSRERKGGDCGNKREYCKGIGRNYLGQIVNGMFLPVITYQFIMDKNGRQ